MKILGRLSALWLVIELSLLIIMLFFGFFSWVFQIETNGTFLVFLEKFYISGSIGNLVAWRAHIGLYVVTVIIVGLEETKP
jgi:hypothetical protein